MNTIKVMIVEDDPVWMELLSEYVDKERDITVALQAYTKEEALQANVSHLDVILMDLQLNEDNKSLSGIEIARKLYNKGFNKIIMLTSWDEEEIILDAFDQGALNYVTKSSYKDIPNAIREAYAGKVSLHADVSSTVLKNLRKERKISVLTPAERQVYNLKEKGLTKKEMATQLFKSMQTIKNQLKTIKRKLDEK